MDRNKPDWAEELRQSPFGSSHFTEELKVSIRKKVKSGGSKPVRRIGAVVMAAGAVFFAALLFMAAEGAWFRGGKALPPLMPMEQRQAYNERNKLLLEVFPDPELKAGASYGYIFSFKAPFEELKGKELSIDAVHLETGLTDRAVKPHLIEASSSGYEGLERYTAFIALPLPGAWRYDVSLDGEKYADVVLQAGEPSWEVSDAFESGNVELTGVEGKAGFIDAGFIAGKANKYMWHFWGEDALLDGKFIVKAVKQGEEKLIEVFHAGSLGGANNGADRHMPSSMSLPEPGIWRLLPYVDGKLMESIVVEVKEK
ncbi:DUF4871 domain-containing protein [Paenibacillus sp. J5C_2022]|uniref:DUF4871 domain-containing protein n=1 Tax=Paenibacillus sp. J5C2022 TaxID=2977129 RepID=UPI0021D1F556|nr:DUF4871 domain-containing protein [Paenibacillus sp. J5C2022]MCU6710215.1 DUF4871 domain-containing protein [Paenibacillus sp. J5C2022]